MRKLSIFSLIAMCLSGCLLEERDNQFDRCRPEHSDDIQLCMKVNGYKIDNRLYTFMADTILSSYCWVPKDTTFWDIQQCPQSDKGKDDIGLIAAVICELMLLWGVIAFIVSTITKSIDWFRGRGKTNTLR
jgi:hypothetical protein